MGKLGSKGVSEEVTAGGQCGPWGEMEKRQSQSGVGGKSWTRRLLWELG